MFGLLGSLCSVRVQFAVRRFGAGFEFEELDEGGRSGGGGVLIPMVTFALLGAALLAQDPGRQQLLATGRLRAGINAANALTRTVGAQLARELARRLDAEVVLIEYPSPGAVTAGAGTEWDIAFIAADPGRTGSIAFTPAYVELDATYLVRDASGIRAVADVDRAGSVIATGRTSAYTLVLSRELTAATLTYPSADDAIAGLQSGAITAIAGLRFGLMQTAARVPGTRVLQDNITRARQAIAVPKVNTAALTYLTAFVADVTRSGFVSAAVEQTGLAGVRVVP